MVIRQALNMVREYLTASDNPMFEAKQLVMLAGGIGQMDFILHPDMEIDEDELMELARRRQSGEPLQYIMGEAEFMSLGFKVNENVLIPRSDTETLAEYLIEQIGDRECSVLDIGAGSGCIGISVAHYCKNVRLHMADISEGALEVAKANAKKHGINAVFYHMDIMKGFPEGKFDVIVSNPPYIRTDVIETLQTEVKDYEPHTALDGGADGLRFYRRIAQIAPMKLNNGGLLALEIGYDQGSEVLGLVSEHFSDCGLIRDLAGADRVVFARRPIQLCV
ncbi:MAG: peptide chain release factor N(5)-glutamine methyltransferase [Clostridiales bacterium]|nr:peptide chain release factor N(5)-glutamine methyltransferase [Clostridiales bacterium]